MRVLIENYRGWEIYFNTDSEDFYTMSNEFDKQHTKKSYSSAKKYIDEFIKENNTFKPIKIQRFDYMSSNPKQYLTLIGIRKDKAFMFEDESGDKKQLSRYDEKEYFVVDQVNEPIFEEIKKLQVQRDEIDEKFKELRSSIKRVTIEEIRKNILGE